MKERSVVDPQLSKTLLECLEEVRKLDFRNAELERQVKKNENQVRQLTEEVETLKLQLQEKQTLEETNLRLQARVLALERTKTVGSLPDHDRYNIEEERQAFTDLQKQYTILEGYYNELLQYVKESEGDKEEN
jgi:hypothetical protein